MSGRIVRPRLRALAGLAAPAGVAALLGCPQQIGLAAQAKATTGPWAAHHPDYRDRWNCAEPLVLVNRTLWLLPLTTTKMVPLMSYSALWKLPR